ncbi:dihydrofolate reductase family protein [Subtercola sp. YIM 133946]|uniref:dihydrofolate reductase family protein n=1 Tax=Subtercola sp. YIM 133946 TaxID=3118909 RepID=UPI002F94AEC3
MKLTTMTQITVDGVVQANGHATPDELAAGFERDGWAMGVFADDTGDLITETYRRADAFLFGRRTYEMFEQSWGTDERMREHPIGVALNSAPKYVVSNSLTAPTWNPTTILSGDVAAAIASLKAAPGGELQVHGSTMLIRWLLANEFIDELTLLTVPVVLGQGARLFPEDGRDVALELLQSHSDTRGVTVQVYRPAGRPVYRPNRPR